MLNIFSVYVHYLLLYCVRICIVSFYITCLTLEVSTSVLRWFQTRFQNYLSDRVYRVKSGHQFSPWVAMRGEECSRAIAFFDLYEYTPFYSVSSCCCNMPMTPHLCVLAHIQQLVQKSRITIKDRKSSFIHASLSMM